MNARNYAVGIFALAVLCAGSAVAQPQQPKRNEGIRAPSGANPERLDRIHNLLEAYVSEGRIAGAVLKVQRDGQDVIFTSVGWQDRESRKRMQNDSVFRIASQTKALTSVGVMMLQEEGRLHINDPVGKYLPEWKDTSVAVPAPNGTYMVVPAKRPITIKDLLTHTSGVSYWPGAASKAWADAGFRGWYFAARDEPMAAVVSRMAKLPMAAQPGDSFIYGYSTDILGVVIEKVSGQSLDQFLKERLIGPLGMKDTAFYATPEMAKRLATVYASTSTGLVKPSRDGGWDDVSLIAQGHYVDGPRRAYSGGAGLLSTADDYSRFLEMMRRGGELDGRRYLSRKSVDLMTQDALSGTGPGPGLGFSLGFSVRTNPGLAGELGSLGDYGWSGAYHTLYWVDPAERLTVVYMVQLQAAGDLDDHAKLRALVYQAIE